MKKFLDLIKDMNNKQKIIAIVSIVLGIVFVIFIVSRWKRVLNVSLVR